MGGEGVRMPYRCMGSQAGCLGRDKQPLKLKQKRMRRGID
jgi:hypothetical protein